MTNPPLSPYITPTRLANFMVDRLTTEPLPYAQIPDRVPALFDELPELTFDIAIELLPRTIELTDDTLEALHDMICAMTDTGAFHSRIYEMARLRATLTI